MGKTKAKEITNNLLNYQFLDDFAKTAAFAHYFFHLLFLLNQLTLKEIIRWLTEDLNPPQLRWPLVSFFLLPACKKRHFHRGKIPLPPFDISQMLSAGKSKPVMLVFVKVSTAECCIFSSSHLQFIWTSLPHCVTVNLHLAAWWPLFIQPWAKAAAWAFSWALSEG